MTEILKRKIDHIDLVLKQRLVDAEQVSPWDKVILTHNALPEADLKNFLSSQTLMRTFNLTISLVFHFG